MLLQLCYAPWTMAQTASYQTSGEQQMMNESSPDENMLLNGGFEEITSGRPSHWVTLGSTVAHESSTEIVHTGTYSVKVTDESNNVGVGLRSAMIPVSPGQEYTASVMSYNVEGTSQMYIEYWNEANTRIDVGIVTNTTQGGWGQLTTQRPAPAEAAYATVLLYLHGSNVGMAYYDDATFTQVTAPVIPELPENGGFEEVVNGMPAHWRSYTTNQYFESSTDVVYAGAYSVKLTDPSPTGGTGIRSVQLPVQPGATYEASVMSYNVEGVSDLYLEFWNANNQRIDVGTKNQNLLNRWENMLIRREAPEQAVYATLLLYQSGQNIGTAYFDEAKFREIDTTAEEFDHLVIHTSKTLYQIGDSGNITWYGLLSNGQLLDRDEVTSVSYESSHPELISIDGTTGQFQVLAVGQSVIKVKVTAMGVTKIDQIILRADDFTSEIVSSKTASNYYTPEKIAIARQNILQYDWAQSQRDAAIAAAAPYVAMDDETLWRMVTPQSLSRSLGVVERYTMRVKPSPDPDDATLGNYGNYPWLADPVNNPWKLVSPVTGRSFPKNDFASFYESGIDEYGMFNYELALQNGAQYLVNLEDMDSSWGIDDGWGWQDESGDIWTFIAYYNHWGLWYNGFIMNALNSLRDAYLFTGNPEYAYKGLLLLDRVADVYPDMDVTTFPWFKGFDNGDPGSHSAQGKVVNDIWETGLVKSLLLAFDAFFPGLEENEVRLTHFLGNKAQSYHMANPKNSKAAISKNIEDNIVRIVYPGMKSSMIRGNMGMHQSALALAAIVLDEEGTSKEWLDFVFESGGLIQTRDPEMPYGRQYQVTGGDLYRLLVDQIDRDGMGNEAAPGYNEGWLSTFLEAAQYLDGYARYPEYDLFKNVKFQKMFSAFYQLAMLGKYTPAIGDSGFMGSPSLRGRLEHDIIAFERWGDPLHAQLIYLKNGNKVSNLHSNIYTENPEQLAAEIERIIQEQGPLHIESSMMNGYGFAGLRDGGAPRQVDGIVFEFQDLHIVESNRGTKYLPQYDALLFQNLDGEGARITFEFEVAEANVYDIDLLPNKAPSYAAYHYEIDGERLGVYDFYGGTAPKTYSTLATRWLDVGTHTLTFEYADRHPSATGYYAAFKQLALFTEAERELRDSQMKDTQRGAWLYYGRNTGHGHKDTLNLGVHAYGMDLAPDLGYPDVTGADPKRVEWTSNTIAHNTVVVNASKQRNSLVGIPHHFEGNGRVQLIDVEAPHVYPDADMYRRTTSMIQVDDEHSYMVDFFRVEGGSQHHYSFHSADGTVTTEGLTLVPQVDGEGQYVGTYAGADIPYGQREAGSGAGSSYLGSGFHYLQNVDRATSPQGPFSIDWQVKDMFGVYDEDPQVHLRLTMLNEVDEVALADGEPPQNNIRSPKSIRYMVAARSGEHLQSTFTAVIEPYQQERYIDSIQLASVTQGGVVVEDESVRAVKVQLKNGRTDYIIYAVDPHTVYTIEGRIQFQGFFGVFSEMNGHPLYSYVQDGVLLGTSGSNHISEAFGRLHGTVQDFTRALAVDNELTVQMDMRGLEPDDLVGRMIYVETDMIRNGVYPIREMTALGNDLYRIGIGDQTLIRAYVDEDDFSRGYVYDITTGASFVIPLSYTSAFPTTYATVEGIKVNGWYTDEVAVTLAVYGNAAMTKKTEYSLDGGTHWLKYTEPIVISESGEHEVLYRSVNHTGHQEDVQSITIRIDRFAPLIDVHANGIPLGDRTIYEDADTVTLNVYATDHQSGIATVRIAVNGAFYDEDGDGVLLDVAGRIGDQLVEVTAVDVTGHQTIERFTITVTTSPESMLRLVERYEVSGDLTGPLVPQLRNRLEQVIHHRSKGNDKQAIHHMQQFLQHLDNPPLQQHRSDEVAQVLHTDAHDLLSRWGSDQDV